MSEKRRKQKDKHGFEDISRINKIPRSIATAATVFQSQIQTSPSPNVCVDKNRITGSRIGSLARLSSYTQIVNHLGNNPLENESYVFVFVLQRTLPSDRVVARKEPLCAI